MSPLPPPHAERRRSPQISDRETQGRGGQARSGFNGGFCPAGVVLHSVAAGQRGFGRALGNRAGFDCGGRQGFGELLCPYPQDLSQAVSSPGY